MNGNDIQFGPQMACYLPSWHNGHIGLKSYVDAKSEKFCCNLLQKNFSLLAFQFSR